MCQGFSYVVLDSKGKDFPLGVTNVSAFRNSKINVPKKVFRSNIQLGINVRSTQSARNLLHLVSNPFEVAKYKSSDLGELLDLLVQHQLKLNELLSAGNFRSKKYLRHRRSISQIQIAIKSITDQHVNGPDENNA